MDWVATGAVSRLSGGGPDGAFAEATDELTSATFTLPADAQNLSIAYKAGQAGASFAVSLLYGTGYSSSVSLTSLVAGSTTEWRTFTAGVAGLAGQSVKLLIDGNFFRNQYDLAGVGTATAPGWTTPLSYGVATGSDGNGTYVTPTTATGALNVRSSLVSPGIVDGLGADLRWYALSYDIGYSTGNLVRVTWYTADGSSNWIVHQDAANTPTGYRTRWFFLADFMEEEGYFVVGLAGGGKVYSLGDNVARQHLAEPFSRKAGHQVDTTTGAFGTQETDLVVPGALPLVLTRYYNGHSDRYGELGYRWSHSYDIGLALSDDDDAVVQFGSGAEEHFVNTALPNDPPVYAPADPRVTSTLGRTGTNPDYLYTYKTRFGWIYRFTAVLYLYEIEDPNGERIELSYDGSDRVETVEAPGGRTLTFTYNGTSGLLETVTGPGSLEVEYGYDGAGDLTSVTNAESETRTYTYDEHRLIAVEDEQSQLVAQIELDPFNRVVRLADADDVGLTLEYESPGTGATEVTDREDTGTTTYYFDHFGRTTHVAAPTGEVSQFLYDEDGQLSAWVDAAAGRYDFSYDDGDLIGIEDPLGAQTSIEVDVDHRPTLVVDDQGTRTEREYDGNGNLTKVIVDATDPLNPTARPYLNLTTEYEYDGAGNLTTVIVDPDDATGDPELNLITEYTSTADGLVETITIDPDDGTGDPELDLTATFVYNSLRRLTHMISPGGRTKRYTHNLLGQLVEVTVDPDDGENPLSSPYLELTSRWVYDAAGRLIIAQDGEQFAQDPFYSSGYGTEWFYDLESQPGLVTRKFDVLGMLSRYEYDADGRMTRAIVDAPVDPQEPTGNELNLTTEYEYDASGRLIRTIVDPDDGAGDPELHLVTEYSYDEAGRLATVTVDPDDGQGDPELDLVTEYLYDANGRLIGKEQPDGAVWEYEYDEVGRLVRTIDPVEHVTEYEYDRAGRRTAVIVDPDDATGDPELDLTTTYEFDNAGRLIATTDPSGAITEQVYDRAGRLVSTTVDPDDGAGDPELDLTTEYAYNASGDLVSVTDAEGYETTYAYDDAGRLTLVTRPGGRVTSMAYDESGRTVMTVSDDGVVTGTVYDLLGRVTSSIVEPDDGQGPAELHLETAYGYDAAGRRIGMTNPRGYTSEYEFDAAGRLILLTDAASTPGEVEFLYDAASRVTRVVNARGYGSDFNYDEMGRVTQLEDPLDRIETREYNGLGQLIAREDPNGTELVYAYDGANRLTTIAEDGGPTLVTFGYDANGRQTGAVNPTGSLAYDYDAAGRLIEAGSPQGLVEYALDDIGRRASMTQTATGSSPKTVAYAYDATTGDLETITDWNSDVTSIVFTDDGLLYSIDRPNGIETLHNYDAAGRLAGITHQNGGGELAEFGYVLDANGNRVQLDVTGSEVTNGTEEYEYDNLDRLIEVDYGTGTAVYTYDANGNRTSVVSGGVTTNYIMDEADQLQELRDGSNVLLVDLDYDANGNRIEANADTFSYDWANRLIEATVSSNSTEFAYLADGSRVEKDRFTNRPYDLRN